MATMTSADRRRFDACFAAVRSIAPGAIIERAERHAFDITAVKKGGVITLDGVHYLVKDVTLYFETDDNFAKELGYKVTELTLFDLKTGATRYLEWEIDDEVEVSFTTKKFTPAELGNAITYADGEVTDVSDVEDIFAQKWAITFNGTTYRPIPDEDWAARFEASDGRKHNAFLYEFAGEDGSYLTIEEWQDGQKWEYEVYASKSVDPSDIEVISLAT